MWIRMEIMMLEDHIQIKGNKLIRCLIEGGRHLLVHIGRDKESIPVQGQPYQSERPPQRTSQGIVKNKGENEPWEQ